MHGLRIVGVEIDGGIAGYLGETAGVAQTYGATAVEC